MPGIGMMNKYSWKQPPVFYSEPGEYDYMPNATKYTPKDLSSIEDQMNNILANIYDLVSFCSANIYCSSDMLNLSQEWNTLFRVNDEAQIVLNIEKIASIDEETGESYEELEDTITTYFKDANSAIKKINAALKKLEDTANKVEKAISQITSDDESIRTVAIEYLEKVRKNGKVYTYFTLAKIGKWVY